MENQQLNYLEEFKEFPLNTEYKVSNLGNVLSAKTGKVMKLQTTKDGYKRVGLVVDGESKKFLVHRIVAKTFLGLPKGGLVVNHKDGNKSNNSVENLEWTTILGNNKHAFDLGLNSNIGIKNPRVKLNEGDVISIYKSLLKGVSIKSLAFDYGVSESTISDIKHRRNWKELLSNFEGIPYKKRRPPLPKDLVDSIVKDKCSGKTNREIYEDLISKGIVVGFYQIKDVGRKFRD